MHPYEIGYIEMHGTGIQAGDGTEMQSVMDIFAPENTREKRNHEQDLHVGSAKVWFPVQGFFGEAASGIASLIKVLLMMETIRFRLTVGSRPKSITHSPRTSKNAAISLQINRLHGNVLIKVRVKCSSTVSALLAAILHYY